MGTSYEERRLISQDGAFAGEGVYLATARGRPAVEALAAGARADRDRAAVGARRRVGVDECDLLGGRAVDPLRGRDDLARRPRRLRVGDLSRRLAADHSRLVLLLDRQEVARHPAEDVVHDRLRDRDLSVLREA